MNPFSRFWIRGLACATCCTFLYIYAGAQTPAPLALPNLPLTNAGQVNTMVVQADGKIVIGGHFTFVDSVARQNLARLNSDGTLDAAWQADTDNDVYALALDAAGNLFVGGNFSIVQGLTRNALAKISAAGTVDANWDPDPDDRVRALVVSGSSLFVGGEFGYLSGQSRGYVAKLSTGGVGAADAAWHADADDTVYSLALDGAGNLFVGGDFDTIGGQNRTRLAKVSLASGAVDGAFTADPNGSIRALLVSGSDLYVAGSLVQIGGVATFCCLARVSAASGAKDSWAGITSGFVTALAQDGNGDIYVGGNFSTANGVARARVAKFLGGSGALVSAWNPGADAQVNTLAISGGRVLLGGAVTQVASSGAPGIAALAQASGAIDATFGAMTQTLGQISVVAAQGNGGYIVGGTFAFAGATRRANLVRFNADGTLDGNWHADANGAVLALAVDGTGDVYVSGLFTSIGGTARTMIAKVSGGGTGAGDPSWNPGFNSLAFSLAVNGGFLYAGGAFDHVGGVARNHVARVATGGTGALDSSWTADADDNVYAVLPTAGGVYLGGDFATVNGVARARLAKVSLGGVVDAAWNPGANSRVNVLALSTAGKLLAGGSFSAVGGAARNHLARVDALTGLVDTAWHPDPNGFVSGIALDIDGNAYITGQFGGIAGVARATLAKVLTDGSAGVWNPGTNGYAQAITFAGGKLVVTGFFTAVGGQTRVGVAVLPPLAEPPLPPTTPGAPQNLACTAAVGAISCQFSPPAPNGTAPVSGYTLTCTSLVTHAQSSVSAAVAPLTVAGLADGTVYACSVLAVNSAGSGSTSAEVYAIPYALLTARGGVDVNGDGRGEVLIRSADGSALLAALNTQNQLVFSPIGGGPAGSRVLGVGDFGGHHRSDLLWQDVASGDVHLWLGFEGPPDGDLMLRKVQPDWAVTAIADIDGDGKSDIVWRYVTPGTADTGVVFVWFMSGAVIDSIQYRGGAPLGWQLVGATDLHGAGRADLVWVSPTNQIRSITALAGRAWINEAIGNVPAGYTLARLGDFDGDGKSDLLFRNAAGQMRLWVMNGVSVLRDIALPLSDPAWQIYAVADLNGDGALDIVWRKPDNTLALWLMHAATPDAPTVILNAGVAPAGFAPVGP